MNIKAIFLHLKISSLCLLVVGILHSCESKRSENIVFQSEDKNMEINISGEKPNALDPWKVNIALTSFGKKDSLGLEIFSGDLNNNTVHCNWAKANACTLKFDQQDNTHRIFYIEGEPAGYSFKEIDGVQ